MLKLQIKKFLSCFCYFLFSFLLTLFLLINVVPFFQTPQFSLILCSYNYGHFLPDIINSVLKSTHKDFELIIVNDGSTDNTQEIIEKYAQKDSRIRLIQQENKGLSIARNNAMKIALGKYFWFIDADDEIDKEALLKLNKKIHQSNPDVISFHVQNMDANKKRLNQDSYCLFPKEVQALQNQLFTVDQLPLNILPIYPVSSAKQIYKKSFIKKNNITFPPKTFFEDDVFFFHTLFAKAKIGIIPETLYYIRKHANSITSDKSKHYDSTVRIAYLIYERLKRAHATEPEARFFFNSYFGGVFAKWHSLNMEQKKKFYPDLQKLLSWIQKQPKETYWIEQEEKLIKFMEKEKPLL